jgi:hypothetical protein
MKVCLSVPHVDRPMLFCIHILLALLLRILGGILRHTFTINQTVVAVLDALDKILHNYTPNFCL